jgi:XTP/dITP diphosphohydrolase
MSRRLVVATRNPNKGGEMIAILTRLLGSEWELKTLADYPEADEPEETGATYAQNATIKAEAASQLTGDLCIADDAGLEVDALGGAPGVFSKRFEGEGTGFDRKIAAILERIEGRERTARFRCCVAIAKTSQPTRVFEAVKEGMIASSPRGNGGFGYDPVFIPQGLNQTYAELTSDFKNEISHRAMVLREAADWLLAGGVES